MSDDFWRSVKEAADRYHHDLNLRGLESYSCPSCTNGYKTQGKTAYDGSGPYWAPGQFCETCGGDGSVVRPCSAEQELKAVQEEAAVLMERIAALTKRHLRETNNGH